MEEIKVQVEELISKTRSILNQRKKRSEKLNLQIQNVVVLLLDTYKSVLNLISSYDQINLLTTEELKEVIMDTYFRMKSLKDSDKFFKLLEWIKKMLLLHYQHIKILGGYQDVLKQITESFSKKANDITIENEVEKTEETKTNDDFQDLDLEKFKSELHFIKNENEKLKKEKSTLLNNYFSAYEVGTSPHLIVHDLYLQSKYLNNKEITNTLKELEERLLEQNSKQISLK